MDLLGTLMHWLLLGLGLFFLAGCVWALWRVDSVVIYEEQKRNGPPSLLRRE